MQKIALKYRFEELTRTASIRICIERNRREIVASYEDCMGRTGKISAFHCMVYAKKTVFEISQEHLPQNVDKFEMLFLGRYGFLFYKMVDMNGEETFYQNDPEQKEEKNLLMIGWFYVANEKLLVSDIFISPLQQYGVTNIIPCSNYEENGCVSIVEMIINSLSYVEEKGND